MNHLTNYQVSQQSKADVGVVGAVERQPAMALEDHETPPYVVRDLSWERVVARYEAKQNSRSRKTTRQKGSQK